MARTQQSTALSDLTIGSCATLASLELPEEIQGQLMHLGFVPESRVLALRRAPAGDPTVYCVDGAEVAFVGRRGADIAGRNRDMELMGYGVDARLVMDPERPTGTCVVMVTHKGDHTMLSDPGANAALSPDDLPKDLFTPGSHLHISGYTLLNEGSRAATLAAFSHAQRAGMSISVDGASTAPLERVGAEPFLQLTNGATLLFVNGEQAKVLTGR